MLDDALTLTFLEKNIICFVNNSPRSGAYSIIRGKFYSKVLCVKFYEEQVTKIFTLIIAF